MNPHIRSIDGFRPARPAMPAGPGPYRQPAPQPVNKPKYVSRVAKPRSHMPDWLQLLLFVFGGVLAGLSIQSAVLGQAVLIIYGILAITLRIRSRTTFLLALLSMIATTLFLVVKGDVVLSQNFATYTFLLLVVGVITLYRELRKEGGRVYSRKTYQ